MIKKIFLVICLFSLFNIQILSAKAKYAPDITYKYVANVISDRVNVRSGSNLTYEIIGCVEAEDKLYVTGGNKNWFEIVLPKKMSVWIHSKLIRQNEDKGRVLKDGVNVRVKPSTRNSIVCQLFTGDEVQILDKKNGWLKITPPEGSLGWIHKNYVKYFLSIEEYNKLLKKQKATELFRNIEAIDQNESLKDDGPDVQYVLALYRNIIENYSEYPEAKLAKLKYDFIIEKLALEDMSKIEELWNEKIKDKNYDLENFKKIYKDFLDKYSDSNIQILTLAKERLKFLQEKDTIILHGKISLDEAVRVKKKITGVVHDLGVLINRPGTHKLIKNGNLICLLRSEKHNLNKYVYSKVEIEGILISVKNWDIPVFEIEKIKKLNWKGRM